MKNYLIVAITSTALFLLGILVGAYFAFKTSTLNSTNQIWAGAKEMEQVLITIENDNITQAKKILCNSIRARMVIMEHASPFYSQPEKTNFEDLFIPRPNSSQAFCIDYSNG